MARYRRHSLGCVRRFQLRARLEITIARFHPLPRQTQHAVFPHDASL
jgi:hypothetical protein